MKNDNTLGNTTRALAAIGILATCVSLLGCNSGADTERQQPPVTPPLVTDTTAPSVPANVTASVASNTRIDVSWSAATDTGGSGLSGYRIYRDGAGAVLATVNAPAATYADSGLAATTQYSYVVRAFDVAGNESSASTAAIATTQANPVSGVSGLDARPSNTTCLAWDQPTASSTISLEPFTSLTFSGALGMVQAPADNSHWYVIEQGGAVKRFAVPNPVNATTLKTLPVTSGGETGLLGIAFHPNFPTDKRIFFSYTATVGGQLVSKITSVTSDDNGATLNATETPVLTLNQPQDNHNGGNIVFGPDGYLYIGFGDGGGGGDTGAGHPDPGNGQRLTTMLGKMLRIDVSPASGYNIPPDNPFAGNAKCTATGGSNACPEIYAWGFRNPWRWSFDRSTKELWVGDVGQGDWEEVDLVQKGGNYGWRCREGANDYASSTTTGCGSATLIEPLAEYGHNLGNAITGGYVYRGTQSTPLKGRFIFADSGTGRIWAWVPETAAQPRQPTVILDNSTRSVVSFGQGNDGELYVVDPNALYHVVFQPASGGGTAPTKLSDTGCVNPADPKQPAAGLIPYTVNAPFWSDGATKERWIGLPDSASIAVGGAPDLDWSFPNRTVLMKNFRVGNKLIETRLFMRHPNGNWGGFTYEWNAQQTDATLLTGGAVRDIGGSQQWIFPSEAQCLECHTSVAGRSLGLETRQLNRNLVYSQTGRNANELFTLNHIATLTPTIPDPAAEPAMPDPADTTAPLVQRARAYLHTNCSQCHRAGGPTPSNIDLRYTAALAIAETKTCNISPQSGDVGLGASARLIVPGNAGNSILVNRMNRRDANGMPRLGSNQVDATGVTLITQWINGMTGC